MRTFGLVDAGSAIVNMERNMESGGGWEPPGRPPSRLDPQHRTLRRRTFGYGSGLLPLRLPAVRRFGSARMVVPVEEPLGAGDRHGGTRWELSARPSHVTCRLPWSCQLRSVRKVRKDSMMVGPTGCPRLATKILTLRTRHRRIPQQVMEPYNTRSRPAVSWL